MADANVASNVMSMTSGAMKKGMDLIILASRVSYNAWKSKPESVKYKRRFLVNFLTDAILLKLNEENRAIKDKKDAILSLSKEDCMKLLVGILHDQHYPDRIQMQDISDTDYVNALNGVKLKIKKESEAVGQRVSVQLLKGPSDETDIHHTSWRGEVLQDGHSSVQRKQVIVGISVKGDVTKVWSRRKEELEALNGEGMLESARKWMTHNKGHMITFGVLVALSFKKVRSKVSKLSERVVGDLITFANSKRS